MALVATEQKDKSCHYVKISVQLLSSFIKGPADDHSESVVPSFWRSKESLNKISFEQSTFSIMVSIYPTLSYFMSQLALFRIIIYLTLSGIS